MKNEKQTLAAPQKDSMKNNGNINNGAEKEVSRNDGSKAQQQSPVPNANDYRSTKTASQHLERGRHIF